MIWQHTVPQRNLDHEVRPTLQMLRSGKTKRVCQTCMKPCKTFPDNEGPESLKALLSFRD